MCQVTPFTLPCCRRIYVQVEKLPSCPEGWPQKKCPKELCVQISGYEPKDVEHRDRGTCWRCRAHLTGKTGRDREELRPVLDTAFIVEGLEEFTTDERKRRVEKAGLCWQCGAYSGCGQCGTVKPQASVEKGVQLTRFKRDRGHNDVEEGKNKRLKFNSLRNPMSTSATASTALSEKLPPDPPSLQPYDYALGAYRYSQLTQPAPTFDYQSQEISYQASIRQYTSDNWQDGHGSQDHGKCGKSLDDALVDPTLELSQAEDGLQQTFELPLHQHQEFPPASDCGAGIVGLDEYHDDKGFSHPLAGHDGIDRCKVEDSHKNAISQGLDHLEAGQPRTTIQPKYPSLS